MNENELERKLQRARNEMLAERFGEIDDGNVAPERPLRDRPLMPNVAELAGEHRGERER